MFCPRRGMCVIIIPMQRHNDFTKGPIAGPLILFALPVMGAMILQSLYGAVDLMIVGKYGSAADVSAVSTGAQIMSTLTQVVVNMAVGVTILLGQFIGAGRISEAGGIIRSGMKLFGTAAALMSVAIPLLAKPLSTVMNAPHEAFDRTVSYVTICGIGFLFIVSYNLLGAVFRGMGDSKTPLLSVAIAAVFNVFGDLWFVRGMGLGASGAAIATALSQGISIVICLIVIAKRGLPFSLTSPEAKRLTGITGRIVRLGAPIALQGMMVSLSFMVIMAIVNSLGLIYSAGVGVAEKVCSFIMLISISFSQAISSFTAQNIGAGNEKRAKDALLCGMGISFGVSVFIAWFSYFKGDVLTGMFTSDPELIAASWDYLRAYAIDTLLTSIMFCFVGYFNGCGATGFVMMQGIVSAFFVRIPVSWLASRIRPVSLFKIGLATPASTALQIVLCVVYYFRRKRQADRGRENFDIAGD